jgi:hypothetical protein
MEILARERLNMQEEGQVQRNPAKLRRTVEQIIRERTFGRVQDLRAELIDGRRIVRGSTRSYYGKSLALEAAAEVSTLICPITLLVDIQVS